MKWRMLSFIFIPLILAGCTAFHYMYQSSKKNPVISEEILHQKVDLEPILREFDGPKE